MRHARLDINEIGGLVFHYLLEGGMSSGLTTIKEQRRLASPAITPQALTWDDEYLWMGSRDLRRIYKIDIDRWKIVTKNRTMSGGSRGLIRGRRNLKSKISRLFRSRAGHSHSTASCSGPITAQKTRSSHSLFRIERLVLSPWSLRGSKKSRRLSLGLFLHSQPRLATR